jgi:O-6-methylguanine DNA methyltransferase
MVVNSSFQLRVLNFLTVIPKGKVVTYGQIAKAIGYPGAARAVGNVLHRNPDGSKYPCYKVVNSKGELSGHFAFGGIMIQQEKLEADGIKVVNSRVNLDEYQFHPVL